MRILIIGAGGHAKVVAEIARLLGHTLVGFLDDNPELKGIHLAESIVLDQISTFESYSFDQIVLGIGNNRIRQTLISTIFDSVTETHWFTAIHPEAIVSKFAHIGIGTVVMAGAIINHSAHIGSHVVINTGSTVDHDCIVDDFAHIAPGVNLAGGVHVGQGSLMGIGSCSIPNTQIGNWVTVGAGATVINDIPHGSTAIGTPARPIR